MICVSITARNNARALKKMTEVHSVADVVELRLDVMESFDLSKIMHSSETPVLVTYRSRREGGEGSAEYATRVRFLLQAVEAGADYVDVEFRLPLEWRQKIFQHRGSSRIVLSIHLRNTTPSSDRLKTLFRRMAATGADIVKIVTMARSWEDNLRVLELIPMAHAVRVGIIAFCMGPLGRISRIACPLMGGYMTFASPGKGAESAPGQIPARDLRRMLEVLSP